MLINKINSTNFNGLWEPVKVLKKENGVLHKNMTKYFLYDQVYHPWVGEPKTEIEENIKSSFFGRSYSISDVCMGDTHFKESVYQMNRVKVGDAIRHEDEEELLAKGYTNAVIGIPSDDEFREIYPNASYVAYDITKMNSESVTQMAEKYFPEA